MQVDIVSIDPPIIIGFAKSATDSTKVTRNAFPRPGSRSGSVTVMKTLNLDAPISRAASSKLGSMFRSRPLSIRYATGKNVIISTVIIPGYP